MTCGGSSKLVVIVSFGYFFDNNFLVVYSFVCTMIKGAVSIPIML